MDTTCETLAKTPPPLPAVPDRGFAGSPVLEDWDENASRGSSLADQFAIPCLDAAFPVGGSDQGDTGPEDNPLSLFEDTIESSSRAESRGTASAAAVAPDDGNDEDFIQPLPLPPLRGVAMQQQQQTLLNDASNGLVVDLEASLGTKQKKRSMGGDFIPTITRRRKKPKGMPKRGLSAYNLYFQRERQKLMDDPSIGSLGFEELGKIVGRRWKDLSAKDREEYEVLAVRDSERYRKEMEVFNLEKQKRILNIDDEVEQTDAEPDMGISTRKLYSPKCSGSLTHSSYTLDDGFFREKPSPFHSMTSIAPASLGSLSSHGGRTNSLQQESNSFPSTSAPSQASEQRREHARSCSLPPSGSCEPPHASLGRDKGRPAGYDEYSDEGYPMLALPPGMELILPDRHGWDRRYRVDYRCYRMSPAQAEEYMKQLSASLVEHSPPPPPPASAEMLTSPRFLETHGTTQRDERRQRPHEHQQDNTGYPTALPHVSHYAGTTRVRPWGPSF